MHYRRLKIINCLALIVALGCAFATRPYSGPISDHFDGTRFYNQDRSKEPTFRSFLAWITTRKRGAWQDENCVPLRAEKPPSSVEGARLRVTFVNHSTFLIQTAGLNVLTDPIWSDRASPLPFAGPRRRRPPGIAFDELPRIDVVLVSHNHYDHLDTGTLKRIAERDDPLVIAPLGNKRLIKRQGFSRVIECDWWQEVMVSDTVAVVCVPAQHFSGRGFFDHYKALWAGFVMQTEDGAIYFAGDTGYGPHIEQIAQRWQPLRLALLPIGAFMPQWFMSFAHMGPADAVQAHLTLRAQTSIGMHFGTFPLADDGQQDATETLRNIVTMSGVRGTAFWTLRNGEGREVPMVEGMREQ